MECDARGHGFEHGLCIFFVLMIRVTLLVPEVRLTVQLGLKVSLTENLVRKLTNWVPQVSLII
jgi:hypothetical protein